MISKKFLTSSIIYTISTTLSTVASFVLLPFYTNTKLLTIGDYGVLSLYIGLSLLVQVFTNMNMDYYITVEYHDLKDQPEKLKSKIASLSGYMLVIGLIIATIFAIGGNFFVHRYFDNPNPSTFRYVMMSVFTGIFNAYFKYYNSLLVNREKPWRFFWSNVLNFVSTIVFTIIVLKLFPLTLEGPIWGRFLSCGSIFAWAFIDITYSYGLAFRKDFVRPAFLFCSPFLVTAFFQWVLSYSQNYIIKPLLFNKELAIFDLAVRFSFLASFLIDGLNSAITPKVFSLMRNGNDSQSVKEINKYYSGFNLATLLLIPLNIIALPIVLPFFISNDKYLTAFLYFGIVCSGMATRGLTNVYMFPILALRKTSRLIWVNGISAALQVVLGYLLIRYFKLYGAVFTLVFIKVITIILYAIFCRDMQIRHFNVMKMVLLPFAVIVITCVAEMFIHAYGLQMHVVHMIELLAITIIAYPIYKNELGDLWKWGLKLAKSKIDTA